MTTPPKLEQIASNLDDLSVTLEEIKEEIKSDGTRNSERLDKVQTDMERATDMIDESLTRQTPER